MMTETEATAKLLIVFSKIKPILPIFVGGPAIEKGLNELTRRGLVNFAFPKDAVEALDNLAQGAARKVDPIILTARAVSAGAAAASASGLAAGPSEKMMSFADTRALFDGYGLTITGTFVKEKSELTAAMNKTGNGPFSLKALSPDVVHKTDMGAVKLGLITIADLEKAWDEIIANVQKKAPQAVLEGMLIQQMAVGREIIIGMKRDPIFGPTVLFGLGGIFTEALKDTSLRIAPVSKEAALEMIHDIHGSAILTGIRGQKPADLDKLADVITKISALAMDHPEIKEIDLNPVMAAPNSATIIDVRVMV